MDYTCNTPDCTEQVTFIGRRCVKHRHKCTQCSTIENNYNTHILSEGLCNIRTVQNRLQKEIQTFVCPICFSTLTIRKGNKYACFDGDPRNYRKHKHYTAHGEVYE